VRVGRQSGFNHEKTERVPPSSKVVAVLA